MECGIVRRNSNNSSDGRDCLDRTINARREGEREGERKREREREREREIERERENVHIAYDTHDISLL